jgi:tRNA U34 5-carboxymethylaminomethyl modifying GTPase MnmE/TrmE
MIEYEIINVDYWDEDALLVLNGHRIYFQWQEEPSLDEALRFISCEMLQKAELEELREQLAKYKEIAEGQNSYYKKHNEELKVLLEEARSKFLEERGLRSKVQEELHLAQADIKRLVKDLQRCYKGDVIAVRNEHVLEAIKSYGVRNALLNA